VAGAPTVSVSDGVGWTRVKTFDDFAVSCCAQPGLKLRSDPNSFSLTQRVARLGPVSLCELIVDSDIAFERGELLNTYRVLVVQSGHSTCAHRDVTVSLGLGAAVVLTPLGHAAAHWAAGSTMLAVKIDRCVVDDALSSAVGQQVLPQIDFSPVMPVQAAPTRSWLQVLALFKEQLFQPDSVLNQPLIALPFIDSLVRGFLIAADHPDRDAVATVRGQAPPRAIRAAVEILETEPHLPLTVSSIAARCYVSVRSLQLGFQHHIGTSPTAYLREVRLRRAHHSLLESDPSTASVASIAYQWGFGNLGRFAAVYAARYDESPVLTLRRRKYQFRA